MTKIQGFAEDGGKIVVTRGQNSVTVVQQTYPLSTVTIYLAGTVTLATIYSDNAGTPKANPFTSASDGTWFFYANDGNYDANFSGTGITTPFTIGDLSIPVGSLNVKSFGAVGNGVVNDYTAIVNAQTAAQALGATLYFPAATYSIGTALVVSGTKTSWQLDPGAKLKYTGGATAAAVTFDGTGSGNGERFDIANLTVDANGLATTAIRIKKAGGSTFTNLSATNATTNGIWCSFCVLNVFSTPTVSTNVTPFTTVPVTGMMFDDIAGSACSANTVINPRVEGVSGTGIKLVWCQNTQFIGGTSESNGTGIELNGASSLNVLNNAFIDMDLEGNSVKDVECTMAQDNAFYSMSLGSATSLHVATGGGSQRFNDGHYAGAVTIDAGSDHNRFMNVLFDQAPTDNGTRTLILGCWNVAAGAFLSNKVPVAQTFGQTANQRLDLDNANGVGLYYLVAGLKNGLLGGGGVTKLLSSDLSLLAANGALRGIGIGQDNVNPEGTLEVYDAKAATGSTLSIIRAGAGNAVSDGALQIRNNADVAQWTADYRGGTYYGSVNQATLAGLALSNGYVIYCSDCTIANPCAGGGSGALAKRINGAWVCN